MRDLSERKKYSDRKQFQTCSKVGLTSINSLKAQELKKAIYYEVAEILQK